jgi:hypothetical protein
MNSHVAAITTKARSTAMLIGRIFSRNRPPAPIIALRLVKAILLPQICYGLPFCNLTVKQIHTLNQIIAIPLRRALGLPRMAALTTLWEFNIPNVTDLITHTRIMLANRSYVGLSNNHSISATLAHDINQYKPEAHRRFCTPTAAHLFQLRTHLPPLPHLPATAESIKHFQDQTRLERRFHTSNENQWSIKTTLRLPPYLLHDPKPAVCIRARLRLKVALTYRNLARYGSRLSPLCPYCAVMGTAQHMLLDCPLFANERQECVKCLSRIGGVVLSWSLILGSRPEFDSDCVLHRIPSYVTIKQREALQITANFLTSVSRSHFL